MYQPAAFREERLETLHELIRAHPLATLVTSGPGGLIANLVPFLLMDSGQRGTLQAHLARGNGQLEELRAGADTLVIFHGPESYITPSWYESKREHGRVVPTWNYVVVQVRGVPRVIDEPAWIKAQVSALTATQEGLRTEPWQVSDAPEAFIDGQINAIVGIEIPIESIDGKWKVSQNRNEADRRGVHGGLAGEGGHPEMARLVGEKLP